MAPRSSRKLVNTTEQVGHFPAARHPRQSQANALGNAKKSYERYISLASAAASTGDVIEAENLYQHAEHYLRLMSEQAV